MRIVAHRGFSSRAPEMTRAAYEAAIAWSAETGVPLDLECDVHFAADDQLICLRDLTLDRACAETGPAFELTVAELREIDFGGSSLVTLSELLHLVDETDADIGLVVETKHPNPRGLDVEERVAELLRARGWDRGPGGGGPPVRLISFSEPAVARFRELLPELDRSFLIELEFGPWWDGRLPDGVRLCGPDLRLIRDDPAYVARARDHGNAVNVWTVNEPEDIAFCLDLGVAGLTTDYPERVHAALTKRRIP